jgi:hypothetical protein
MTYWIYSYATFDGFAFRDIESMGDIGSPLDFPGLFYCAGRAGWELCGTFPAPGARFKEWQGQRDLILVFKRPTKDRPLGPFIPTVQD